MEYRGSSYGQDLSPVAIFLEYLNGVFFFHVQSLIPNTPVDYLFCFEDD